MPGQGTKTDMRKAKLYYGINCKKLILSFQNKSMEAVIANGGL